MPTMKVTSQTIVSAAACMYQINYAKQALCHIDTWLVCSGIKPSFDLSGTVLATLITQGVNKG